jgi:hypothetical protein
MFKKIFLELLRQPRRTRVLELIKTRNILGSRRFRGSTNAKDNKLLPAVHHADPNYPKKLKTLKNMESGLFLLSDQEVQTVKELFEITDLEERGSRNLGNTGITFYIADNKYYIKK